MANLVQECEVCLYATVSLARAMCICRFWNPHTHVYILKIGCGKHVEDLFLLKNPAHPQWMILCRYGHKPQWRFRFKFYQQRSIIIQHCHLDLPLLVALTNQVIEYYIA